MPHLTADEVAAIHQSGVIPALALAVRLINQAADRSGVGRRHVDVLRLEEVSLRLSAGLPKLTAVPPSTEQAPPRDRGASRPSDRSRLQAL